MKLYNKVEMAPLSFLHENKYFNAENYIGVFYRTFYFTFCLPLDKTEKYLKGDSSIKTNISVPNKYVIGELIYP